jgi:hypothetical protein
VSTDQQQRGKPWKVSGWVRVFWGGGVVLWHCAVSIVHCCNEQESCRLYGTIGPLFTTVEYSSAAKGETVEGGDWEMGR